MMRINSYDLLNNVELAIIIAQVVMEGTTPEGIAKLEDKLTHCRHLANQVKRCCNSATVQMVVDSQTHI